MAAGGLVELLGGTPAQVDHAVAFALANVLGSICDPVEGLVEVPCVQRNVMGAVNAAACAEMALAGMENIFGADAVIETMGKVGRRLPEEFRETARGAWPRRPGKPETDSGPGPSVTARSVHLPSCYLRNRRQHSVSGQSRGPALQVDNLANNKCAPVRFMDISPGGSDDERQQS